jgi:hypothetical protein
MLGFVLGNGGGPHGQVRRSGRTLTLQPWHIYYPIR